MNKVDILIALIVVSTFNWMFATVNHNHSAFVAWIIVIILSCSIIESRTTEPIDQGHTEEEIKKLPKKEDTSNTHNDVRINNNNLPNFDEIEPVMKCISCNSIIHLTNEQRILLQEMLNLYGKFNKTGIKFRLNQFEIVDSIAKCCDEPNYWYVGEPDYLQLRRLKNRRL